MPSTYYVDPAAGGSDTGADWTNAWTTLQRAIDGTGGTQPVAGDIVLCRGTETVSAATDFDGNSGNHTNGPIIFRGVNSSGANDGTKYKMTSSTNSHVIWNMAGSDLLQLENFELESTAGTPGDGINANSYASASNELLFHNIYVHGCANGVDFGLANGDGITFTESRIDGNSSIGLRGGGFMLVSTSISNNGSHGLFRIGQQRGVVVTDCLIEGNGGHGFDNDAGYSPTETNVIIRTTIDGNTNDGINWDGGLPMLVAYTRLTENGGYGVNATSNCHLVGCYIPNATEDRDNASGATNGDVFTVGVDNDLAGTDSGGGYENAASGNFALASAATLRNLEIDLDGTTSVFVSAGLSPTSATGGGGSTIAVTQGLHAIGSGINA